MPLPTTMIYSHGSDNRKVGRKPVRLLNFYGVPQPTTSPFVHAGSLTGGVPAMGDFFIFVRN
jgi:hypothetical protein